MSGRVVRVATRTAVERAALRVLQPLESAGVKVAVYNGEVQKSSNADELRAQIAGRIPAVLLATTEASYVNAQAQSATVDLKLEVYAIAGSLRAKLEATQGGPGVIGVYELLEGVRGLLMGADLQVDGVAAVLPSAEKPLFYLDDCVVWMALYNMRLRAIKPRSGDLALVDVLGNIALPLDEDATGTVRVSSLTTVPEE